MICTVSPGQGHDPFDDIASQRLVADDNDIVIVQTVWQTEFLKEDRLPGGIGRFHGRTVYKYSCTTKWDTR